MSNSLDPDQARPDLAPNCLQKLAADDITLVDKELMKEAHIANTMNSERTNSNKIPKPYHNRNQRYPSLVLVQPRKTRPNITERLSQ